MTVTAKLGALVLSLTPFIWSMVVHTGAAPTPMSIPVPPRPALAFRQYAVDLGMIQPTAESRATFVFANRGANPVEITNVVASCSCLVPRVDQKRFQPGEEGRIVLRIQTANESPGPKELFADVFYNDPEPRQVRLTYKLELPAQQMTVTPPALLVYHPEGSDETIASFTVKDGRKKSFEILSAEINTDLVSTSIGDRSISQTGEWTQVVKVAIPGVLPAGKHPLLLRIRTSDADYPELRVPLMLQGPALPKADGDEDHEHDHKHVAKPEKT
ncbi:MAG: DUF1573 domain-containing protein [Planctomycetaceae bacterium]